MQRSKDSVFWGLFCFVFPNEEASTAPEAAKRVIFTPCLSVSSLRATSFPWSSTRKGTNWPKQTPMRNSFWNLAEHLIWGLGLWGKGGVEQFKWVTYLTEHYLLSIIMHMHINDIIWIFNTFFPPECPVLQSYHGAIPKSCWWSVVSVQVSLFSCCCWAWQLGECLSTLKCPLVPFPRSQTLPVCAGSWNDGTGKNLEASPEHL